jgi:ParB family chromosome partitioning protein
MKPGETNREVKSVPIMSAADIAKASRRGASTSAPPAEVKHVRTGGATTAKKEVEGRDTSATETVKAAAGTDTVETADATVTVKAAGATETINAADSAETVKAADAVKTIESTDAVETVKAAQMETVAAIPAPADAPIRARRILARTASMPSNAGGDAGLTSASDAASMKGRQSPAAGPIEGGSLQWIDVDRIRPNPLQPRKQFPEEELQELAASIRSSGILQPVIVRRIEGGYGLVAGERRWRAAQRAGLLKVPALIRDVPENRLLEVALVENIQRQDLNPIEEARAYRALTEDLGLSQVEVAERVGRQRSTISNSLRLLALSPRVQDQVEAGALSMGHARALVSLPGPRAQELGAEVIIKRGMSVREAEAWVTRHTDEPAPSRAGVRRDPNVGAAEEALQRLLGTRVRIVPGKGEKGRILIDYYSAAELDRLYERLAKA